MAEPLFRKHYLPTVLLLPVGQDDLVYPADLGRNINADMILCKPDRNLLDHGSFVVIDQQG